MTATSELVFERGVQGVTVALISDRAGVSRKTFYDILTDRDTCLLTAFEEGVQRAGEAVEREIAGKGKWSDTIRSGLAGLLSFLDAEPVTGRLLIVEALAAGDRTLEAREDVLTRIVAIVDQGRTEAKAVRYIPPLTAEGVVGAVFSVLHSRMLAYQPSGAAGPRVGRMGGRDARPLVELTGPLTGMIVQPYLGPVAAKRELDRPAVSSKRATPKLPSDPFKDLPIRLTYRTAQVLSSIAAAPGASNKQVATASCITDEGQTSRLLARLERAGLIHNTGPGPAKGEANAWTLTIRGQDIHTVIAQQTGRS
ncbi:MAG: TetR family transcriptional regulator [Solirubrobacteraceae bacterium]